MRYLITKGLSRGIQSHECPKAYYDLLGVRNYILEIEEKRGDQVFEYWLKYCEFQMMLTCPRLTFYVVLMRRDERMNCIGRRRFEADRVVMDGSQHSSVATKSAILDLKLSNHTLNGVNMNYLSDIPFVFKCYRFNLRSLLTWKLLSLRLLMS